ncbi:MAG: hypothetical protein QOJ35_2558 [Solirubrobacteraceae bacterium]|nr:hypothetical protein [Solirubrobacteraceae bacterium]
MVRIRRRVGGLSAVVICVGALAATATPAAVNLSPGDILVTDGGNELRGAGGVIRVDPAAGAQTMVLASGRRFGWGPVAFEPDGDILAAAGISQFGAAVFRVDPVTFAQTRVSGGPLGGVSALTPEPDGDILILDASARAVIRLDGASGAATTVSSGGSMIQPLGIALEADGDILVSDRGADGEAGAVIRVDPLTGAQSTLSSGGSFVDPSGVAVDADGQILLADPDALGGAGAVIRVDPVTGAQTTVSSGGSLVDPTGIAVDADGHILVVDRSAFTAPDAFVAGAVIRIDPLTGAQTTLSSGGLFVSPYAIALAPQANEPPDCSTVTASPSTLLRASRDQLKTITLSGARDPDGDTLAFRIDSVDQDEPVSGTVGKQTFPDAQLVGATADTNRVRVRAERDPKANGRVYRIAYTVSDTSATCSGIAKVSVPRNKPHSAVDDGNTRRWNSLTGAQIYP